MDVLESVMCFLLPKLEYSARLGMLQCLLWDVESRRPLCHLRLHSITV